MKMKTTLHRMICFLNCYFSSVIFNLIKLITEITAFKENNLITMEKWG